ncbi:hypothetical protein C4559_05150 [Candidatus Microgenomates bacterium]|nr:MAG: hypothetical protein C4559_05150 [Candidatus Microgenomates bacterium]
MKKIFSITLLVLVLSLLFPVKTHALSNVLDTISTSQSSTPLNPVTALHTISFQTSSAIPSLGRITFTFPSLTLNDANNPASPSASTFQLNGLSSSLIRIAGLAGAGTFASTITNPTNSTPPSIQIDLTGTTTATSSSKIIVFLGCATNSNIACTKSFPTILNPTKSASLGKADLWTLQLTTRDVTNNKNLESKKIKIGTFEQVQIQASIDPTLTFAIGGITDNTPINIGNTKGCNNNETTNSGFDSTAKSINLGRLISNKINTAGQRIIISTNDAKGYSLTASSNNHFADKSNSFRFEDSAIPNVMTQGTTWFGVHPCGLDVNKKIWGEGTTGNTQGAKYAWPNKKTSLILASDLTGPIAGDSKGNGVVNIEYSAAISTIVPAGEYSATITYTVMPNF